MTDRSGDHPVPAEAGDRRIVVVPRSAGPLIDLADHPGRPSDDLDALIDDIFGAPTSERPGRFDLALVAAGAILLAWALVTGATGFVVIVATVLLILGLVLPVRAVARVIGSRRQAARRHRVTGTGLPLDASSPATSALVAAYGELREAAALPGVARATDAIDAGYLAVFEVATLLAGSAPIADEQVAYIERRTDAIRSLTHELRRLNRQWEAARTPDIDAAPLEQQRRARAMTRAREELESERFGSIDQIETLTGRLRRYADHDPE